MRVPSREIVVANSSLAAIDEPSPANIAMARAANLAAATSDPKLASQAVLALCTLGQVDDAFDQSAVGERQCQRRFAPACASDSRSTRPYE